MFSGTAFLAIWLILPLLWHYLLKAAGLSLWRLTIPTFVILFFYIHQYVGLPVLYFQLDESRAASVNDQWLMIQVSFYTALTITLMILGFIVGRRVFGQLKWCDAEIREINIITMRRLLVLFCICSAVLLLYLLKVEFDKIAILQVLGFGDESLKPAIARSEMGNAFEGRYYLYSLFMNKLLLFSVYAFWGQCLLKPNLRNILLFCLAFLVATFVMIMSIAKTPMAELLIALFLIYVIIKKKSIIPIMGAFSLSVVLVALLSFFYILFLGVQDISQAIISVGSRTFTGAIQPAYHYLEYFPYYHDFLLGRSFPNPASILPFDHFFLTKEMMDWYNPRLATIGIVGSMPTVYWGEMYANFGFWGVLLPPFFVGLVLYWVNNLIFRMNQDAFVIALFVWLSMYVKNLSGTSLSMFIFNIYAIVTLCVFFVIGRGQYRITGQ